MYAKLVLWQMSTLSQKQHLDFGDSILAVCQKRIDASVAMLRTIRGVLGKKALDQDGELNHAAKDTKAIFMPFIYYLYIIYISSC